MSVWLRSCTLVLVTVPLLGCEVDTRSSLAGDHFAYFTKIVCDDANSQRSQYEKFFSTLPDDKRIPIEQQLREAEERCEVLAPIKKITSVISLELQNGIVTPRKAFLFELIDIIDGESDTRLVGFFESLDICREQRAIVESVGYRTNPCYSRTLFWKAAWT